MQLPAGQSSEKSVMVWEHQTQLPGKVQLLGSSQREQFGDFSQELSFSSSLPHRAPLLSTFQRDATAKSTRVWSALVFGRSGRGINSVYSAERNKLSQTHPLLVPQILQQLLLEIALA